MTHFLIGLVITFVLLLLFSKWKLWIGVLAGSITFGLINLGAEQTFESFIATISNINNWFLVIAVGLIPVLGGIISNSIHMNVVLSRLKGNKKVYFMVTPALFGLIPIPGGALMSCPLLRGVDENTSDSKLVAINIWFRHIFVIVYPLSSSLIIAAQLGGLTITTAILHMLPYSLVIVPIGYFAFLSKMKNQPQKREGNGNGNGSKKEILCLAVVLLSAPILHIILVSTLLGGMEQLSFFISMTTGVFLAVMINRLSLRKFLKIFASSKVDQFSLLFLFLLIFIGLIRSFEGLETIFAGFTPPLVLVGLFAFLMSFVSGRIEVALSITYPLLFASFGSENLPGLLFSFIYFSLFAGYLISPLHPCMAFSIEYFETKYYQVFKKLFPLIMIPFVIIAVIIFFVY